MRKILIWALVLGTTLAYGENNSRGFPEKNRQKKVFLRLDRSGGYRREFQHLMERVRVADNQKKFELNGFIDGFSYGYEWTNRVSFELGIKVYVLEEDLEEEEYLQEEAWQHSLYASIGYKF